MATEYPLYDTAKDALPGAGKSGVSSYAQPRLGKTRAGAAAAAAGGGADVMARLSAEAAGSPRAGEEATGAADAGAEDPNSEWEPV